MNTGMYVEFHEYDLKGVSQRKIGQWMQEYHGNATIYYHVSDNKNHFLTHPVSKPSNLIKRADIKSGTVGRVNNAIVTIIRKSRRKGKEGHSLYYCLVQGRPGSFLISENNIKVPFDAVDLEASDLFLEGDFCMPSEFRDRYNIVKYTTEYKHVPDEYESIIGNKVELLEHQLETVKRVTKDTPIRAILADEVGLGKTIEALAILDYALRSGVCKRALIIVPEQLKYQWSHEAASKFNLEAPGFMFHEFNNAKKIKNIYVISDSEFYRYYDYFNWNNWDFVICDEVHRAVKNDRLYSMLLKMCKLAKNVLLLSATPLLQRGKEMYRLLKLFNPEYYSALGINEFNKIISARRGVIDKINSVSYGFKMKEDLDHARKCLYACKDIAIANEDRSLINMLGQINNEDESSAVDGVKLALDYIDKRYEISPKYIRHRRSDILDPSSKRCLFGEVEFIFDSEENNLYHTMREELEAGIADDSISTENIMAMGNAFFSSACALNRVLIDLNLDSVFSKTFHLIYKLQRRESELLSNSRLDTLVNYLDRNESLQEGKAIIFTDYIVTAKLIRDRLSKEYGENRVALFSSATGNKKSFIANKCFRNVHECSFLVCDKTGAEGRNFQFADTIIHFDSPWIPTDLEQRIGRLDRIGRGPNRPVKNVVLFARDSIEEDLISMCKNDLNIYEESLSGIEIVFDQITALIKESIRENALLGFDLVGDEVKELKRRCEETVQQEAFEQMCMQMESGHASKTQDIINSLSGENYKQFVDSLCAYHSNCGYDVRQTGNRVFIEGFAGIKNAEGTFSVKEALEDEELSFLSLSNPLISRISQNAIHDDSRRTSAIHISGAGFEWRGFVGVWESLVHTREYYPGEWKDFIEKMPYLYMDESILLIAENIESTEYSADTIMSEIMAAICTDRATLMDRDEINDILDFSDLEYETDKVIEHMRKTFLEIIRYKFNFKQLNDDIENAKREYYVSQMLRNKVQMSKTQVEALIAIHKALDKVSCRLDSLIFVSMER